MSFNEQRGRVASISVSSAAEGGAVIRARFGIGCACVAFLATCLAVASTENGISLVVGTWYAAPGWEVGQNLSQHGLRPIALHCGSPPPIRTLDPATHVFSTSRGARECGREGAPRQITCRQPRASDASPISTSTPCLPVAMAANAVRKPPAAIDSAQSPSETSLPSGPYSRHRRCISQ